MNKYLLTFALGSLLTTTSLSAEETNNLYPQHFPLNEVTLGQSPLRDAMVLNFKTLLAYDADRLMTPFIRQAGLSSTTDTTSKYYKWTTNHPSFTNWGLSDWSLEGHVGGHYLTALALGIAASENDASLADYNKQMKEKLDYCIDILKDCQDAFKDNTTGLQGFIGGQPFTNNNVWTGLYANNLSNFKAYGGWVPFYCEHKVLAGLRDAYIYAGNETAKDLFKGMADWSVNVVSKLSTSDMQTVLGWEHGGMNETLADAYYLFGDSKYLDAAKKYSHTMMISGMQTQSKTFLDGKHANTQVPKYIGFERIYQLDNSSTTYQKAAHNFWQDVVSNRTVCIGGNSVDEHFLAAASSLNYINNLNGPESCNTNNMLKLSEELFDETHDSKYVDFYEQAMYNHILSTQDPTTGGYVYFTSLRPQSYRIYSKVNQGMWCCVGTGMENHSKYGHFIYTKAEHPETNVQDTLFVNLFVDSKLTNSKYAITQKTKFPYEQKTVITIDKSAAYTIAIRKPSWVGDGFKIINNSHEITNLPEKDGYVYFKAGWMGGKDTIEVELPMKLTKEQCPNLTQYQAFRYGPILLGAKTTAENASEAEEIGLNTETLQNEYAGTGRMDHAPGSRATSKSITSSPLLICNPDTVLNLITLKDSSKLLFTINAPAYIKYNAPSSMLSKVNKLTLEPFYSIHHARYNCYWYTQSAEDFKKSDIGQSESINQSLNDRTLDYVGTGEQQSEAGHLAKYSASSTTGDYNYETYRDAPVGGYIQYTLVNTKKMKDSLAVICRFNTADVARKCYIWIDDVKLPIPAATVKTNTLFTIPSTYPTADDNGFFNIEYRIPNELLVKEDGTVKDSLVFKISSGTTLCPGLYYLRLVKILNDNDIAQGSYRFVASDWTTGDEGRVAASKFSYDNDANTISVNAGTGANNVALTLDLAKGYTVSGQRIFLYVRGTDLKTSTAGSYLWWLNGKNAGTSVSPTKIVSLTNGDVLVAWDMTKSGLNSNCQGNLYNFCQGKTIMGFTSTTGTSIIKDINFTDNLLQYINNINANPTAVSSVSGSTLSDSDSYYTVSGIRTAHPSKGINIVKNKKRSVKIMN